MMQLFCQWIGSAIDYHVSYPDDFGVVDVADELTQAMVQELIEKVVVMDLEHVEIVWKFKDEVRNFIGI